jgi:hypothetical protein
VSAAASAAAPRETVEAFGAALVAGKADRLRVALPDQGKVLVGLARFGPEIGALRGGHLGAVLSDFLERGSVTSFTVRTVEQSDTLALATADVTLIDADGSRANVRLHLSLEPENGRWVLREIRESSR